MLFREADRLTVSGLLSQPMTTAILNSTGRENRVVSKSR
ncbi:hypothetical protein FRUB_05425 [Fimbriiglobus ruber]|uniref:Uncharacterized protein n=1 Tax=Fimbriiglobus ruber TaxID=1908690 RepID=A0A225DSB8_9BACT|nr:hypothetical protein FRUB_05425 [Fimbriiglobus ruber]